MMPGDGPVGEGAYELMQEQIQADREETLGHVLNDNDTLVKYLTLVLEEGGERDREMLCRRFRDRPRHPDGSFSGCSIKDYVLSALLFDFTTVVDDLMSDR